MKAKSLLTTICLFFFGQVFLVCLIGHVSYQLFMLGIVVCAMFSKPSGALVALAAFSFCLAYFFLEPRWSLQIDHKADVVGVVLFLVFGALVVIVCFCQQRLHKA